LTHLLVTPIILPLSIVWHPSFYHPLCLVSLFMPSLMFGVPLYAIPYA
jgi:hypothetical protein